MRQGDSLEKAGYDEVLSRRAGYILAALVILTIATIPIVVDRLGLDAFRLPKDLLFRASAIVLGAALAILTAFGEVRWSLLMRRHRFTTLLPLVIVAWTTVAAIASTNRALSRASLATAAAGAILFIATFLAGRTLPIRSLYAVLLPALINAAVLLLTRLNVWNPVDVTGTAARVFGDRYVLTALLGNADDAGSYLSLALVASLALTVAEKGWKRAATMAISLFFLAAIIITGSTTAIVSAVAVLVALAMVTLRRSHLIVATLSGFCLLATLLSFSDSILERASSVVSRTSHSNQINRAFSGRFIAFASAAAMARDHPFIGIGPGCFRFQYFAYKIVAEKKFPDRIFAETRSVNFAQAHNDHLQFAAELGLAGYLLFLASCIYLARLAFTRPAATQRGRAARILALGIPVAVLIEAMGFFPLQVAACSTTILFLGGASCSWLTE